MFVYSQYQPTPYDLGITDDPDAQWPEPVNGIRPSQEVVAAHFGYASAAEMEDAAEAALEAAAEGLTVRQRSRPTGSASGTTPVGRLSARAEAGLEPEAEL